MKTIEQRAEKWGEYITERTPYDIFAAKYSYMAGANEQKDIDDVELLKLKMKWEREAQIHHNIVMKSIEERAKKYTPNAFNPDYILPTKEEYLVNLQRQAYIAGATDQKNIDEEVRLKKSDAMTKAEYNREVAFVDWYHQNGKGTPTYSDAIEWARKDVISKVCDWLHLNLPNIEYTIKELKPLRVSRGLLIDELKKAMDK